MSSSALKGHIVSCLWMRWLRVFIHENRKILQGSKLLTDAWGKSPLTGSKSSSAPGHQEGVRDERDLRPSWSGPWGVWGLGHKRLEEGLRGFLSTLNVLKWKHRALSLCPIRLLLLHCIILCKRCLQSQSLVKEELRSGSAMKGTFHHIGTEKWLISYSKNFKGEWHPSPTAFHLLQ